MPAIIGIIIVFSLIATVLSSGWDMFTKGMATITGNPAWKSRSVQRDNAQQGFSFEHRLYNASPSDYPELKGKFRFTNSSDTPITYIYVACTFDSTDDRGGEYKNAPGAYEARFVFDAKESDGSSRIFIAPHSTAEFNVEMDEKGSHGLRESYPYVSNSDCNALIDTYQS